MALSVEILKEELEAKGHEVWIFAPDYPSANSVGARVIRFPSIPSLYPKFRIALPFRGMTKKIFRDHLPDVIHSHSIFGLGRMAIQLSREFHVPLVYTLHTRFEHYTHNVEWAPEPAIRWWLDQRLRDYVRHPKSVLIPTKTYADEIRAKYGLNNVHPFYTAVRVPPLAVDGRRGIRRRLGIREKDFVFLIVGRLSREKNIDAAIEIFAHVASEHTDTQLIVVAEGPEKHRLQKKYADTNFARRIHWMGAVPHASKNGEPSVFDFYAAADAFLFMSQTETQGMVLSEAMAMGLVVFALRSPASEEIILNGQTGVVRDSVESVVAAIRQIMRKPNEIQKISQAARSFAQKTFGMSACASLVENVYRSVL